MARSQGNASTISLGLEGYEIGEVIGEERGIVVEVGIQSKRPACPHCNSVKLYRHKRAKKRRVLHGWSQGKKVTLRLLVITGDSAVADIPAPKV